MERRRFIVEAGAAIATIGAAMVVLWLMPLSAVGQDHCSAVAHGAQGVCRAYCDALECPDGHQGAACEALRKVWRERTGSSLFPCDPVTCEPVTVTQTHGDGLFVGNLQLGRVVNGKIPCVHSETFVLEECVFNPDRLNWLESLSGRFVPMGQATSLNGAPGEFVTAGQVSAERTMSCIEPAASDTVGAPAGVSLASACTPETLLSPRNASGFPLENFTNLEVCSIDQVHPDAHAGGPDNTTCFLNQQTGLVNCCWTGEGAALNDRTGRERDINNVYLSENRHCHMSVFGTTTFPAAKRPGMKFENGALVVDDTTPIVWRPVSPVPNIANGPEELGTIIGDVNLACADATGTLVSIPGRSFSAITDSSGQFELSSVPIGAYTIRIDPSGPALLDIPGVVVRPNRTTDLGTILIGSTDTDINNCGACGTVCSAANGTPTCTAGSCQIAFCNAGFANCDGIAANGCETNLQTDRGSCGLCNNMCAAGQACVSGTCQ